MTRSERQALIDRTDSRLSNARQCQLLKVARSTLYYRPTPVNDDDPAVMRRLGEQYLATPFYWAWTRKLVLHVPAKAARKMRDKTHRSSRAEADKGWPRGRRSIVRESAVYELS